MLSAMSGRLWNFQTGMIDFYKSRFSEEIEAVFKDGVEYDDDNNGTIDDDEKTPINDGRLVR